MKIAYFLSLTLTCFFMAVPAMAKDKKDKHGEKAGKHGKESVEKGSKESQAQSVAKVTISPSERESIQKFLSVNVKSTTYTTPVVHSPRSLPPGLAKKAAQGKPLPPGWQKKMQVGQVIPVDVYDQCEPLPPDLIVKLPPQPKGILTVTIEGKVVRLLEATREILDVFDVFHR
jgi:hypothetical protein